MVNIRKMMEMKAVDAKNLFGNILQVALSEPVPMETNKGRHYNVVRPMRDSMKAINAEFVKKLQHSADGGEPFNTRKQIAAKMKKGEEVLFYAFSSVCNSQSTSRILDGESQRTLAWVAPSP